MEKEEKKITYYTMRFRDENLFKEAKMMAVEEEISLLELVQQAVAEYLKIPINTSLVKARQEEREKIMRAKKERRREYINKWSKNYQKRPEEKFKNKARDTIRRKIKKGEIKRGNCEVCGIPKTEAHHDDYNKPLEVRWLCREHHNLHHKNNSNI